MTDTDFCERGQKTVTLTVGSLFAVMMGPTTPDTPLPPLNLWNSNPATFLLGIAIVAALAAGKYMMKKRRELHDGSNYTV